jgi:hypothetical protein
MILQESRMKVEKSVLFLSVLIAIGAAVAAGMGVFSTGGGGPFPFTTVHGDTVMMHGSGLYRYDSVSGAAQVRGNDVVVLALGIPLLLVSAFLAMRGSLRGLLLLIGTLGFFLYTYTSLAFLVAYNPLFLLYVALFSMSLFAFVISLVRIDTKALAARFSPAMPRVPVAIFLFIIGLFLLMNWVGRLILPTLMAGSVPQELESYTTLVIQALDLGLIVPAAFITGILLLQRKAVGYLLASVVLVKGVTMSAGIAAMIIGMLLAGVNMALVEVLMFPVIGLVCVVMTVLVLRSVEDRPAARLQAKLANA